MCRCDTATRLAYSARASRAAAARHARARRGVPSRRAAAPPPRAAPAAPCAARSTPPAPPELPPRSQARPSDKRPRGKEGPLDHWRLGLVGSLQYWSNGSKAEAAHYVKALIERLELQGPCAGCGCDGLCGSVWWPCVCMYVGAGLSYLVTVCLHDSGVIGGAETR